MKNSKFSKGFTLVEVLVGTLLILVIFLGIFGAYQLGLRIVGQSKARVTATAIANEEMEKIRNLPYEDVGFPGDLPSGVLERTKTTTRNNIEYKIDTDVDYVINCLDGFNEDGDPCPEEAEGSCPTDPCPVDECPFDYKRAGVKVSWSGRFGGEVSLSTDVAPKYAEQECGEIGGLLLISVADAKGGMVAEPTIKIIDPDTGSVVESAAPSDGEKLFALAPDEYKIVISKEGYSTDQTYGSGDIYNGQIIANPEKPHAIVLEGKFVERSFSIDKASKFFVYTKEAEADRIYYVRKTGSDEHNGLSPNEAFLTIQKAANVMTKGDIVCVGAGTYEEEISPQNSGKDEKLITYVADVDGSYTGDAGEVIIKGTDYGFYIDGKRHLKIYGFKITNASNSAILIMGSSSDNIVTNNDISGNAGDGIRLESGSNNILSHNTIYSNQGRGIYLNSAGKNDLIKNIVHQNSLDGIRVESSNAVSINFNTSYLNGANGILVLSNSQNCVVTNNVTYSNAHDGIQIFDQTASIEVIGNKSYSNVGFGITFKSHITNANKIASNLVYANKKSGILLSNNCVNTTISNNTSYKNEDYGLLIEEGSGNNEIRDNIITSHTSDTSVGIKVSDSTNISISYNNVWGNTNNYDPDDLEKLPRTDEMSQDPLFVDPDGVDNLLGDNSGEDDSFHLFYVSDEERSPCIDAGSGPASDLGMSDKTTQTNDEPDIDEVDMGYHYSLESPPSLPPPPSAFGIPIGEVNFHLLLKFQAGEEVVVGTDAAGDPIYKFYKKDGKTDINGYCEISNLEWGSYLFSNFSDGLLDLIVSYPSYPLIHLSPDVEQEVRLGLRAEDTLLVTVIDKITEGPVFSASVKLSNTDLGYDETKLTDEKGQVYFIPLDKDHYVLEIKAEGYVDFTDTVSINGHEEKIKELEPKP